ncbi:hypothetical protein OS493_024183 [Desmophyllum pertusum]|uniref:C2H2-type domain-containing protein n=1 Tax=Desmophyllum pertusum TaxID=174260 RepID=A0A9W9ZDL1_9CNID|nr:hypothetical protein OS493_024183 [Desmophyllum pertusum]
MRKIIPSTTSPLEARIASHRRKTVCVSVTARKHLYRGTIVRDHERIHTGEKPCKCAHCDETFRCSQAVKEHEKSAHNLHLKCDNLVQRRKFIHATYATKTFSWSMCAVAA